MIGEMLQILSNYRNVQFLYQHQYLYNIHAFITYISSVFNIITSYHDYYRCNQRKENKVFRKQIVIMDRIKKRTVAQQRLTHIYITPWAITQEKNGKMKINTHLF